MTTILYFGTHGYNDPTKATIPFFLATGAIEAGHHAQVVLGGDATIVIKDSMMGQIQGVGIPALQGLITQLIEHGVPIYV